MKEKIYCPGFGDAVNGMSVVAKLLLADPQGKDERIVHGAWLVGTWLACIRFGNYVRMPHGAYDPVRLAYHGWKKRLVGPIERFFLRRATKVLATCEAEAEWIRAYEPRARVEVTDIKRFFKLESFGDQAKAPLRGTLREYAASPHSDFRSDRLRTDTSTLHILYLGRRHPLKGVEYLERAVEEIRRKEKGEGRKCGVDLRIVSNHSGAELESDWEWCDVLVLPTLSENFGLVVAEALERGKRVVTTDGAPVWEPPEAAAVPSAQCLVPSADGRLVYLKGYREGTDEERVELLKRGVVESGSGEW